MDEDLPRGWLDVLDAVARAEWAWTPVARLDAWTVTELIEAGWLELWEGAIGADGLPCGPSVTLTVWAAERLRTTIVDTNDIRLVLVDPPPSAKDDRPRIMAVARDDEPRWGELIEDERTLDEKNLPRYSPLPSWDELPTPRRRVRTRPHDRKAHWFDPLPDERAANPVDAAIAAEEFAMAVEFDEEEGRPRLDLETGKVLKKPVIVWGKKIKVDPKIKGKRGKPR